MLLVLSSYIRIYGEVRGGLWGAAWGHRGLLGMWLSGLRELKSSLKHNAG